MVIFVGGRFARAANCCNVMPHGTANYGSRIKKVRLAKGMSLRDVADEAGLSAAFLSRIERGERGELTLSNAVALCAVLGLTLDELVGKRRRKQP